MKPPFLSTGNYYRSPYTEIRGWEAEPDVEMDTR
jgi:hypothetical protein